MTPLRQKMVDHMQLRRLSPSTQHSYAEAVAGLARFYHKTPDKINNTQIQAYLLYLMRERQLSWSSCNVIVNGLRFFYTKTLGWDSVHFNIPPCKTKKQLPEILSKEELERLFSAAAHLKHRVLLMTTYSAGLRVSEVVHLQLTDIDSKRMLIRIVQSKGNKDRYVNLSENLLPELRYYWRMYRPQTWLFTSSDGENPLSVGTAQKIYYSAKEKAGIKKGKGIHTLRHCYATHLLESGVDLPTIQKLMGHESIRSTMLYLQITPVKLSQTQSPLDLLDLYDTESQS